MDSSQLLRNIVGSTNHRGRYTGSNISGSVVTGINASRDAIYLRGRRIADPVVITTPVPPIANSSSKAVRHHLAYSNITETLTYLLEHIAAIKDIGPTLVARFLYIWFTSVAHAWSWVSSESAGDRRVTGSHDGLDWTASDSGVVLTNEEQCVWINRALIYIMQNIDVHTGAGTILGFATTSHDGIDTILNNERAEMVGSVVNESIVMIKGRWDDWTRTWGRWYDSRESDGSINAKNAPEPSDLPNGDNVLDVYGDITNFNSFPDKRKWVPLKIGNNENSVKNYLTFNWSTVHTTMSVANRDNVTEESIIKETIETYFNDTINATKEAKRNCEIDSVVKISETLSDHQKVVSEFWAGGSGTATPPGQFAWFWKEYINLIKPETDIVVYSGLDLGIHLFEGSRITWGLKKHAMEARPLQEIRTRYAGKKIVSWKDGSEIDGSVWVPFQEDDFITPPFPDFPSGHSHFSAAFVLTMKSWFGPTIQRSSQKKSCKDIHVVSPILSFRSMEYGTMFIPKGSSQIHSGAGVPENDVYLSWYTWDDMAHGDISSGFSQFYGGIHTRSAHDAGMFAAKKMDERIAEKWVIRKPLL